MEYSKEELGLLAVFDYWAEARKYGGLPGEHRKVFIRAFRRLYSRIAPFYLWSFDHVMISYISNKAPTNSPTFKFILNSSGNNLWPNKVPKSAHLTILKQCMQNSSLADFEGSVTFAENLEKTIKLDAMSEDEKQRYCAAHAKNAENRKPFKVQI